MYYLVTTYEIIVYTGGKRNAGTDSQVYVTLFGKNGKKTGKIHLQNSNNKDPFERNQADKFHVQGEYIGELIKLRIEHDNSGLLSGWFLDRIVVTDLNDSKTKYTATCNKWLAKDEDDKQISRELILTKQASGIKTKNQYKITIYTGNKKGAGTDANVFITLYGNLGETGAIMLDSKKKNFEVGQKDEFTIECPSVGELNKILIAHNNKGLAAGWFLDRILIEDLSNNHTYEFPCYKWLAKDEDDKQISRFLFPKKSTNYEKEPTTAIFTDVGISYTITVYTGNKTNAGTDARVYIVMHGKNSSSSKIFLNNGKFEKKSIDKFTIDVPINLSPLAALDIGHDNSGIGSGWYLDKVIVECPSTGIKQTFPCNNWLADNEGDKRIERRLKEDLSLRETNPPAIPWYIWIYTSDKKGAGTNGQVNLVLYGYNGKSKTIKLERKSDTFQQGHCDQFATDIHDIGIPFKLRVNLNNYNLSTSWHLDRIEMQNLKTNQQYTFHCGRWLSKIEDDKQIIRELPAEGSGISRPLPIIKYIVDVYTGNKTGAGTDANVFINIYDECGDTGVRYLEYSLKNKDKFEQNQVDSFIIEAVLLKQIRKIRIGHDGTGSHSGWFLNKVVIRQDDQRSEPTTFICNRWFAVDEDDGKIVRELTLTQHLDKITYNIKIKTGDIFQAGTDADVHLKIFGEKGNTDRIQLRTTNNTRDQFERGQIDNFTFEIYDLGKIEHILIGHNGKNSGAGWFLDWIEINVPIRHELYRFTCNRWLDKKEGDGKIELDLKPSDITKKPTLIPYEVTVFTGDKAGAGTDAKVFIQIYGSYGKTEEIILSNRSDSFERKSVDQFKIEAPDIGPIQKIRIGHHSENFGASWYLEKVLIQRYLTFKSDQLKHLKQINTSNPNVEEYWFICRQWFDKDQGDKQTIRELLPTIYEHDNVISNKKVTYLVHVFTGDKSGAGTDANVFLTIYGQNKDSGERQLIKSKTNSNRFERKQEDIFEIKSLSLGRLTKIKIRHDNKGLSSAWYLDRIEIADPDTGFRYYFICEKWLAVDEGDKMLSREIYASENKSHDLSSVCQITTYRINVITSDKFGSGTNAKVYIIIFGELNNTGKISLVTSKTNKDPFEKGHKDLFEIETIDIGQPKKIIIGHDESGFASDWLLERVEIDIPTLGHTWIFPCGKRIRKTTNNVQAEVELYPIEMSTGIKTSYVPYEIKVYTSKLSGAGTDANVYIQIYGLKKSTDQVMLRNTTDRQGKFYMGSIDTFIHELEDVGDSIEKIRIGHDNHGFDTAWHLDRVEIRRLIKGQKTKRYVFRCNCWLAKDKDDGSIVRELIPENFIEEKFIKKYLVDVYTGDKSGSSTDANVFLTIYGDKNDTDEHELKYSQTNKNKFERNQIDRFIIENNDLGNIYKLKIRHDNSGMLADWFLEKIEIKDEKQTYIFNCKQWLAMDKNDSKLERIFYEKKYQDLMNGTKSVSHTTEKFIPYIVKIKTGEASDAGTSANVFIRLIGSKDRQTPMMRLEVTHRRYFEPGKIETFPLQELDIGDIEMVEIEHNGNTLADSWFLDSVIVEMPTKGRTFYFVCNDWLSKCKGDGKTKRILKVQGLNNISVRPLLPYVVKIYTGHMDNAGCDCDVSLRLFGMLGSSSEYMIRKQGGNFEQSAVDMFQCEFEDVGKPIKLRVAIFPKSIHGRNHWYLEKIQLIKHAKQNINEETYSFVLNNWIGHGTDYYFDIPYYINQCDSLISNGIVQYEIVVVTSDLQNAGTTQHGWIIIEGNKNRSEKFLMKNTVHQRILQRGQTNTFTFGCQPLGELRRIILGHQEQHEHLFKTHEDDGTVWHVSHITITDLSTGIKYEFPVQQWITINNDGDIFDYMNNREYFITQEHLRRVIKYKIIVHKGYVSGASTDTDVSIILYGTLGNTDSVILKKNNQNLFELDGVDEYVIECSELGKLTKLHVEHHKSMLSSECFLDQIEVINMNTNEKVLFPCKQNFGTQYNDHEIQRDLLPIYTS
ncbi:unnamed protein product [Rotaria sordida]|uniref:PLAT domain-containing protein n=1 Tax=Rotaria sordida TaxID=392033 RepID=A0A814GE93_9BILA|nr:unnamed protein product [Rotaria sordida]CAF0995180.1 unnamed protein product [Rotaria sordida]